jgi:hypothetical protein
MTKAPSADDASRAAARAASLWLRRGVAFVWLWTGLAVFHPYYRAEGEADLAPLGLPPAVIYATCAAEVLLGLRVALGRAATWVTALQVVLIGGFTTILSVSQPALWLAPLGVLTKNLALLVMIGSAWLLEREVWSERAWRLLLGGMATFWLADGVLSVFMSDLPGGDGLVLRLVRILGRCELAAAVAAAISLMWWERVSVIVLYLLLAVQIVVIYAVTACASHDDELAWFHPFGPLTKNVPVAVATLVVCWHCFERDW